MKLADKFQSIYYVFTTSFKETTPLIKTLYSGLHKNLPKIPEIEKLDCCNGRATDKPTNGTTDRRIGPPTYQMRRFI